MPDNINLPTKKEVLETLNEKVEIKVDKEFYKQLLKLPKERLAGIVLQLTFQLQQFLGKCEMEDLTKIKLTDTH
jgi:hypothetical protein